MNPIVFLMLGGVAALFYALSRKGGSSSKVLMPPGAGDELYLHDLEGFAHYKGMDIYTGDIATSDFDTTDPNVIFVHNGAWESNVGVPFAGVLVVLPARTWFVATPPTIFPQLESDLANEFEQWRLSEGSVRPVLGEDPNIPEEYLTHYQMGIQGHLPPVELYELAAQLEEIGAYYEADQMRRAAGTIEFGKGAEQ
jgi:hypothetical protein